MSALNGDKSRFQRRRKAGVLRRERARITALLLGLFVVLMFAITIAKMAINR